MPSFRLIFSIALLLSILAGCSEYKQVDDPSDGGNGKFKHHPTGLSR